MGASLALIVALMLLKATNTFEITWWWWYPLPAFVASGLLLMVPSVPKLVRRNRFSDGPQIPALMAALAEKPLSEQEVYVRLIQDLYGSWRVNDGILRVERACVRYGEYLLALGALVAVGLYSWGLN
jgi:hypothetical protein